MQLVDELKHKVLDILNITDIRPENISEDEPLVGGSLGIDSIDILELVMLLEQDYGVKIDSKEEGEQVFRSFASMAAFVRNHLNNQAS